jgi:hypothetical protein
MRKFILVICLILSGCEKSLTNEEIVKEVEFCKSKGLIPHLYATGLTIKITRVQCQLE